MSGWTEAEKESEKGRKGEIPRSLLWYFRLLCLFSLSADLGVSKDNGDSEPDHLRWTADPPPAGAVQVK